MSDMPYLAGVEEQHALEQFYYREARLLDARQYQQWLALMSDDVRYIMPARSNVQVNNRDRGNESMISVERELETPEGEGNPLRDESMIHLMVRVERAFKINSWSENPPARTRRIVSNVELLERSDEALTVWSNFLLYYTRPGSREFVYGGQRRDVLLPVDASFKVHRREIILDYGDIDKPTLGLLF